MNGVFEGKKDNCYMKLSQSAVRHVTVLLSLISAFVIDVGLFKGAENKKDKLFTYIHS